MAKKALHKHIRGNLKSVKEDISSETAARNPRLITEALITEATGARGRTRAFTSARQDRRPKARSNTERRAWRERTV